VHRPLEHPGWAVDHMIMNGSMNSVCILNSEWPYNSSCSSMGCVHHVECVSVSHLCCTVVVSCSLYIHITFWLNHPQFAAMTLGCHLPLGCNCRHLCRKYCLWIAVIWQVEYMMQDARICIVSSRSPHSSPKYDQFLCQYYMKVFDKYGSLDHKGSEK